MSPNTIEDALELTGSSEVTALAHENYLARVVAEEVSTAIAELNPRRLSRLGYVYEIQSIGAYERWIAEASEPARAEAVGAAAKAYACWRSLSRLTARSGGLLEPGEQGAMLIANEVGLSSDFAPLELWFRLATAGTLAEAPSETRLELSRFSAPTEPASPLGSWRNRVLWEVLLADILLTRKGGGWSDVNRALEAVGLLRSLQSELEEESLNSAPEGLERMSKAIELVGLYNMAQMVATTGDYLKLGEPAPSSVAAKLDRYRDNARSAFVQSGSVPLAHYGDLLWVSSREFIRNSIWTHTRTLGERIRDFARYLANKPVSNVLELWPSQQIALRGNVLDPYRQAVVVQMPTSAGKTLLAKFAIVQTKALNPSGTVVYLVPTRALVNQVTFDLRTDLASMGIQVEQAVPAFELDPTENLLLGRAIDVIVSTPEKFDLLLRKDHQATRGLALVVADEAHNLNDGERGARLELLLGTIRRDRPGARFLLLSPFLPNAQELVDWIGDGRGLPPIFVNWRPGKHIVGALRAHGKKQGSKLFLRTLAAAANADLRPGIEIPVGQMLPNLGRSEANISISGAMALHKRGGVLVLCRGRSTAVARAVACASRLPARNEDPDIDAVCRYILTEVGRPVPLMDCIKKGVAYHHAGLSQDIRWLIESLIADGKVTIVCGTSTLAQGVNFPISTVLVETLRKGDKDLTHQDFWNIAGRAGRTLMDHTGIVAFPVFREEKLRRIEEFLRGEAEAIVSQLSSLVDRATEIEQAFNLHGLKEWPELSPFLQFLAHAMRVARTPALAEDIEDLLRASLIYHQARRRGPEFSLRLVSICRSYLEQISQNRGILGLADQTGFSTPSVLEMLREVRNQPELRSESSWNPDRLFSPRSDALAVRIAAIAELPEIRLGAGRSGIFSPERVAAILQAWVNGETLDSIARTFHPLGREQPDRALDETTNYLFSRLITNASWGLGALQVACLEDFAREQTDIGFVPAMIYFGVKRPEAVWFRMAGVPRMFASRLADLWARQGMNIPESYSQVRDWVLRLSPDQWQRIIPEGATIRPEQCILIWKRLSGVS